MTVPEAYTWARHHAATRLWMIKTTRDYYPRIRVVFRTLERAMAAIGNDPASFEVYYRSRVGGNGEPYLEARLIKTDKVVARIMPYRADFDLPPV